MPPLVPPDSLRHSVASVPPSAERRLPLPQGRHLQLVV